MPRDVHRQGQPTTAAFEEVTEGAKYQLYPDRAIGQRLTDYEKRHRLYKGQDIVITGIATGIDGLDGVTMGVQPTDLWVVQGRTGIGKTYFVCQLAAHMRSLGHNVLFINREMDPEHVMGRIDALSAHFSFAHWRAGQLTPQEYGRYKQLQRALLKTKGRIDIVPPIKFLSVRTINTILLRYPAHIVIVDYINRLQSEHGVDNAKTFAVLAELADGLKDIAYRKHIPVIAVAQTNRSQLAQKAEIAGTEHIYGGDALGWNADLVLSMFRRKKMLELRQMGLQMVKYRHGEELEIVLSWKLNEGVIAVHSINDKPLEDLTTDTDALPQ